MIWKLLLAALVGFCSFSVNIFLFGQVYNIALLPLGVWILSFILRNSSWQKYRRFAWTGFWANYIFLVTALLGGLAHQTLYDKDDPFTYMADLGEARIADIHPSARDTKFDEGLFREAMASYYPADIQSSLSWFYDSRQKSGEFYQHERFPYALFGAEPKWGSGLHASIYLEIDGMGLLIESQGRYSYYRSEMPLMEMEAKE
ncbi:hypothetical protein [Paenibacillus sp. PL2-23]|uniref:hypothetical protein n=1 Tax=Paenibacillus sp. PL2-23 TaxID=2100729 RepID=UPI0030FB3BE2